MNKLNDLLSNWKPNTIFTTQLLNKKQIYPQLINRYNKSNWLESVGVGAYKRVNDEINIFGGIYTLQNQLNLSVHIGGKSSLGLQGILHYISSELLYVELYGSNYVKLPKWFTHYKWQTKIIFTNKNIFKDSDLGIVKKYIYQIELLISSPERAIFELLDNVPKKVSFDEAFKIFESLFNLRPSLINKLLLTCTSIKVKRLFLFFAEQINHSWFQDLNLNEIKIGSGNRVIIKGGILNKKYKITIPEGIDYDF